MVFVQKSLEDGHLDVLEWTSRPRVSDASSERLLERMDVSGIRIIV
jgi:hypothetical protein